MITESFSDELMKLASKTSTLRRVLSQSDKAVHADKGRRHVTTGLLSNSARVRAAQIIAALGGGTIIGHSMVDNEKIAAAGAAAALSTPPNKARPKSGTRPTREQIEGRPDQPLVEKVSPKSPRKDKK